MSSNPDKLLYVQPKFIGFKVIRPKAPLPGQEALCS